MRVVVRQGFYCNALVREKVFKGFGATWTGHTNCEEELGKMRALEEK